MLETIKSTLSAFRRALSERFSLLLVLLGVFAAYVPCLAAGFVNYDDDIHVFANIFLQASPWPHVSGLWTTTVNYIYIPLTTTSWSIERYFFGDNPWVFHLDNILLHLAVTALVFVFCRRMGLSVLAALLGTMFFGLHPIHVQSVAWITERKDVLYGLFYMLALLAYLRYLDAGQKQYFWLTVLLSVVSICAKPMAASMPFVLLVLDCSRGRALSIRMFWEKALCGVCLLPIMYVTYSMNSHLVQPAAGPGLLIWSWCFVFYLSKFFFPWPLIMFYTLPMPASLGNAAYVISTAAFVAILASLWFLRHNRWLLIGAALYFANIFFMLRFSPQLDTVSDRYMYLASIGPCMFLAACFERWIVFSKGRAVLSNCIKAVLCALVAAMAVMTFKQCGVWQDSEKLWRHELQYNFQVGRWLANYKLAEVYMAESRSVVSDPVKFARVRALYQRAIELSPDYPMSYYGMSRLLAVAGDAAGSRYFYNEALKRDRGQR